MFEPFQQFIKKAANHYGISKEVEAAKICHDFDMLVPQLFTHPEAKDHVSHGHFKDSTLVIKVQSPAWAHEVIMRKTKIIEEMNKKAGSEIIKNLKTQMGVFSG